MQTDLFANSSPPERHSLAGSASFVPEHFELRPGFLTGSRADQLLTRLVAVADWRDEFIQMFGKRVRSPRRVCWYGDAGVGYEYSGLDHRASGWLPELADLRAELAAALDTEFNFVLLNYYADQNDSMGWHADDEPELGAQPTIASLSFGAQRTFLIRPAQKIPGGRRESQRLYLAHGSLLVMRGDSQRLYQHALPKSRLVCGPRLNLTFRQVHDLSRGAVAS